MFHHRNAFIINITYTNDVAVRVTGTYPFSFSFFFLLLSAYLYMGDRVDELDT